jgi:hypothetical protein
MKKVIICILVCMLMILSTITISTAALQGNTSHPLTTSNMVYGGTSSIIQKLSATDSYDLLIIAPDIWKDELESFQQHKEDHGIRTVLVGLNEIYSGRYFVTEGRDSAEQIKYFIKNALDTWKITYVLFVGGRKPGVNESWFCPVRYVEIELSGGPFLSDLYFSDIYNDTGTFQSWDTNNDNKFGAYKDKIDLYPDVYIGRWACRSLMDLRSIIQKTIRYENTPTHSKKIVLVSGDVFNLSAGDDKGYIEGEMITEQTANYLTDYETVRVYASQTDVTPQHIRDALGQGCSFMHFDGHCWITYWSIHKPTHFDQWEKGLGIWDLLSFSNTEYPIVVLGGCRTAQFNVAVFNRPEQLEVPPLFAKYYPAYVDLSWEFARKINGGSVATIGYTISPMCGIGETGDVDGDGIVEPDCIETGNGKLEPTFFYAYGVEKKATLGECWNFTLSKYIKDDLKGTGGWRLWHILTIYGFVVLGDPSLKIGGYPS